MTREEAIEILNALAWVQGGADREETITAISIAIEALKILSYDGIVNCCGCIHWNEYGFCNLTDKHREDFDYCSDGRREP